MNNTKNIFSTVNKNFIRQQWNKPIIKFLSKKVKEKLVYMGLPSSEADDIAEWIEHIKSVIAFQCREYGNSSKPTQTREPIIKLEVFLRTLERQGKIDDYVVYDGYLEEVVLRGYDNSPNEITFNTNRFITLYNLDFCNNIASPIEFTDKKGDIKKVYKFNAIQRLLEIQKSLSKVSNKFIFFLTVHCSYDGEELQNFLNTTDVSLKAYLQKYFSLKGDNKNAEIVRLFVCSNIQKYFSANNFSYHILPIIKYQGINNTPLLHFAVLGVHSQLTAEGVANLQSLDDIVKQKFIKVHSEQFENESILNEEQHINNINPIDLFLQSTTFNKLWK